MARVSQQWGRGGRFWPLPGADFRLLHCFAVWPWGHHLTSLGLSFLSCRVRGVVVLTSQGHGKEK